MIKADKKFMQLAIKEAEKARQQGDYAVGAVLVKGNNIVAACSNRSKRDESPIAHAEVLAIVAGSQKLKTRHLSNCILYCTHEPCPMCAAVAVWARLKGVVYGARISDMKKYQKSNANGKYLWRSINISFEKVIKSSTEPVAIVKDFMRPECIKLFHNEQI